MSSWHTATRVILLGLAAIFVQATLFKALLPAFPAPNLALLLVIYLAFKSSDVLGAFLAFLLGLEVDLYSGVLLGPWAGSFVTVYSIYALVARRLFVESYITSTLAAVVATCLATLVYFLLIWSFLPLPENILWKLTQEAIVTGVFAAPFMVFFDRLLRAGREERKTASW
ncbi:MAG: rod shape-determining protein MreD [Candidatus Dadabacteria bacterium]|nr:MAG: rod shape-determining protein MreD [Candidatus Dadabacteria bacterium]